MTQSICKSLPVLLIRYVVFSLPIIILGFLYGLYLIPYAHIKADFRIGKEYAIKKCLRVK